MDDMVRPLRVLGGCLAAMLLASAAVAAPSGTIAAVRVGVGDGYKLGHWTPVWVTLEAGDDALAGKLQITAPDGDDSPATFAGGQLDGVNIPAGESRTVMGYVRVGRRDASLLVRFVSEGSSAVAISKKLNAADLPTAAIARQQRVVVIGAKIDMDQAIRFLPCSVGEEIVADYIDNADALPDRWYGYDGVDALVLTASRPEIYDQLSGAQRRAIVEWVQQGGRAILTVGGQGETALRADGFLAQLAGKIPACGTAA